MVLLASEGTNYTNRKRRRVAPDLVPLVERPAETCAEPRSLATTTSSEFILADARHAPYYSRDIQLMRRATPSPQAPLRMSAPTMILGSQPPATPIPLSGNTTKSATALGPTAPISR